MFQTCFLNKSLLRLSNCQVYRFSRFVNFNANLCLFRLCTNQERNPADSSKMCCFFILFLFHPTVVTVPLWFIFLHFHMSIAIIVKHEKLSLIDWKRGLIIWKLRLIKKTAWSLNHLQQITTIFAVAFFPQFFRVRIDQLWVAVHLISMISLKGLVKLSPS